MIRSLTPDEMSELMGVAAETGFGTIDTTRGCLPLRSLDVDVWIDGLSAHTTVKQQFVNVFEESLEATYVFPLPPRAAVTGFRMTVAGATIVGRIDERQKARDDYDAAIANGRKAAITEQERADVFTLRVGNIPPGSAARVEFTLDAPLAIDSLEATYRFPLVVAPRYCPGLPLDGDLAGDGIAPDTDRVPDASRISPPVLLPRHKSPVRLSITAHIGAAAIPAGAAPADPVACSLPADEEIDEHGTRIVTVVPDQRLDRDFILRWKLAADVISVPAVLVEPDAARPAGMGTGMSGGDADGDGTFSLTIVPPADARPADLPRDVVFLLDRSGSMGGWKMVAARRAVARMVDTLSSDDRVAVLAFDTVVEFGGPARQLVSAADRHRWELLEWLAGIGARGGTELAAALTTSFDLLADAGADRPEAAPGPRQRFIVLVTDGQVGDEDHVIRRLSRAIGDTRLFVVGIDTAVNEGLLGRMADASGGLVEFVESEDRLDEVMDRIHARIATPLITGLSLEGDGVELVDGSIVPGRLPELMAGVPLTLWGRYRGDAAGRIRVRGRFGTGGEWEAAATIAPSAVRGLGSLWAKGMLRHLEDLHATALAGHEQIERRLVALSTSSGVLCRFTAAVAIDDREPDRRFVTPIRRIIQPVDSHHRLHSRPCFSPPTKGFGDLHMLAFACMPNPTHCAADPLASARAKAKRLLAAAKPRRGTLEGLEPSTARRLLRGILRVLRILGGVAEARPLVERLATAYGRLYALLDDRPAIVAALDELAAFVEEEQTVDRWWARVPIDEAAPF